MSEENTKFEYQVKAEKPGSTSGMTETDSEKSALDATERWLEKLNEGGAVTIVKRKKNEQS